MTELTLRAYIREIDALIEQEKLDEAIAHARHILQRYPKNIECYRLLGKAYLEAKRFGDAADIFQRVLSAVPDDFVSHIGMSIVREDEGNLDSAIWHMERAFETNPANPAIQQELKRLIGRRDGFEPHKVRLTRGALARMYSHGELYPQAIAELQSALQEDSDRPDLQILLAEMYWQTDQRREAAEVSGHILEKLPYCVKATKIMAAMLQETGKIEEAAAYHRRLAQLDPYMAYIETPMADATRVDAETIEIRRLSWRPGQPLPASESEPADWAASLGLEGGEGEEISTGPLPSWLSEIEPDEDTGPAAPAPAARPEAADEPAELGPDERADIPDWMQEAGWQESSGEAAEQPVSFSAEELDSLERGKMPAEPGDSQGAAADDEEVELVRADIPSWLQGMAPGQAPSDEESIDEDELASLLQREVEPTSEETLDFEMAEEESQGAEPEGASDVPGWLDEGQPGATSTIMTWLGDRSRDEDDSAEPGETAAAGEELPDWMSAPSEGNWGARLPQPAEPEAEGPPSWLSGVAEAAAGATEAEEEELARLQRQAAAESSGAEASGTDELPPDWLQAIARDEPEAPEAALPEDELELPWETQVESGEQDTIPQGTDEDDAPEWLLGFSDEEPGPDSAPDLEVAAAEEPEADDAWLADLSTGQADEQPEASSWLEQLGTEQEAEASASADIPDWMEGLGEDADEGSPAGDEVEQLASTWLDDLSDTLAETPAEPDVLPEFTMASEEEADEAEASWGPSGMEEPVTADEVEDLSWLDRLVTTDKDPATEVKSEAEPEPASAADVEPTDEDSVFSWMDQMAAEQAAEAASAEPATEQPAPELASPDAEAPPESLDEGLEWLDRLSETRGINADVDRHPAPGTVSEAPPSETAEVPAEPAGQETWPPSMPTEPAPPSDEEESTDPGEIGPWEPEPQPAPDKEPRELPAGPPDWPVAEAEPEPGPEPEPEPAYFEPEDDESEVPEWLRAHAEPVPLEPEEEPAAPEPPASAPPAAETIVAKRPVAEQPPTTPQAEPPPATPPAQPAEPSAASQPEPADPDLQAARHALAQGDRDQAASTYSKLVKAKRQIEPVVHDLEAELEQDPDSPQLWQVLGDAYMRQNRAKEAVKAYNRGMEETEMLDSARQALAAGDINRAATQYGMLIKQKTEIEAVIKDLETATGAGEGAPMLWQTLGDAYMKAGRVDDSIKAYRRGMDSV